MDVEMHLLIVFDRGHEGSDVWTFADVGEDNGSCSRSAKLWSLSATDHSDLMISA
jgi:hypothetical protein